MNYNSWTFWVLFAAVMLPYWHLAHKRQNRLLLAASYLFYGFWDYRFLFLVLVSTYIDFIGGLGVAGIRVSLRRLIGLTALVTATAAALCTGIQYDFLARFLASGDWALLVQALPHKLSDFYILIATAAGGAGYVCAQPWLYAQPDEFRRKAYLVISMVANLAILGFFKYCDFFISSLTGTLHWLGLGNWAGQTLGILLPAGISFYTFQAMSYTIDIYRREAQPTEDFMDFALFVCFFPHLVAGPIMRAHTLLPQVTEPRTVRQRDWEEGLYLVLVGLFKKIVIADNMAPIANSVFLRFAEGTHGGLTGVDALIGVYAFAMQIYGDFSGYSSVARGISKWLGFELCVNFNMPYLAVSPSDFWQRWHISLSSWLRDYLYIPLGGSHGSALLTYRNLMITMLLGGLWHGASWTFVAWGFYHGAILCLFRWFGIRDTKLHSAVGLRQRLGHLFRIVFMFHLTCIGWLLFRAETFPLVTAIATSIVTDFVPTSTAWPPLALMAFYCGPLFLLEWWLNGENRVDRLTESTWCPRGLAYTYVLAMMLVFHAAVAAEFIYFQF